MDRWLTSTNSWSSDPAESIRSRQVSPAATPPASAATPITHTATGAGTARRPRAASTQPARTSGGAHRHSHSPAPISMVRTWPGSGACRYPIRTQMEVVNATVHAAAPARTAPTARPGRSADTASPAVRTATPAVTTAIVPAPRVRW
nr:hypothetical protein GCM10020092_074970 [Actinoplanes digitatis]